MKRYSTVWLITISVAGLVALVAFYVYPSIREQNVKRLKEQAYNSYHKGDPQAMAQLEKALQNETDPQYRAGIAASLSLQQIRSDDKEDQEKAVKRVKTIIASSNIKAGTKARMINLLVDFGVLKQSRDFMENIFFSDDPYNAFFRGENKQIFPALVRIQEWSVEIFPTAQADLRLAEYYSSLAVKASRDESLESKKTEYISKARYYLQRGESLMERDRKLDTLERAIGYYTFKASAYGELVLVNEGDSSKAEELFKEAINLAETFPDAEDIYTRNFAINARARYAMFVLDIDKNKERENEIREILKPFGSLTQEDVQKIGYVHMLLNIFREGDGPETMTYQRGYPSFDYYKRLADISPEFEKFLDLVGFKKAS